MLSPTCSDDAYTSALSYSMQLFSVHHNGAFPVECHTGGGVMSSFIVVSGGNAVDRVNWLGAKIAGLS